MEIIISVRHRDENIEIRKDYMINDELIGVSPPMLYDIVTHLKNEVMEAKAKSENIEQAGKYNKLHSDKKTDQ